MRAPTMSPPIAPISNWTFLLRKSGMRLSSVSVFLLSCEQKKCAEGIPALSRGAGDVVWAFVGVGSLLCCARESR